MILPTVMKAETKAEFITNKGKEDNTNVKDVQNQKQKNQSSFKR